MGTTAQQGDHQITEAQQKWLQLVLKWQNGSETGAAFARTQRIKVRSLYRWKSRLKELGIINPPGLKEERSIPVRAASNPQLEEGAGKSSQTLIECVECGERISSRARLCRICKSPQDWTRFLFRWKEVIAAVLAVAPLWAGAFILVAPLLKQSIPRLKVLDVKCEAENPTILLSNSGDVSAIVRSIGVNPKSKGREANRYQYLLRPEAVDLSGWIEVAPQEAKQMRFVVTAEGANIEIPRQRDLLIYVEYLDGKGVSHLETSAWPCGTME